MGIIFSIMVFQDGIYSYYIKERSLIRTTIKEVNKTINLTCPIPLEVFERGYDYNLIVVKDGTCYYDGVLK